MDKVTIPNARQVDTITDECYAKDANGNKLAKFTKQKVEIQCVDSGEASDGYHTFNSLYRQRMILSAALAKLSFDSWKSKLHSDGTVPFGGGQFIMGWSTPQGQYTYHYELKDWDKFDCKELEKAPEWDGHTDADVERLLSLKHLKVIGWDLAREENEYV